MTNTNIPTTDLPAGWILLDTKYSSTKVSTTGKKVKQKEYLAEGLIPVIDQGQELIGDYTNDTTKKIDCQLPVVVFGDHTKTVKFINFEFAPGADGVKIIQPIEAFEPKLFTYFLIVLTKKIPDKGYARHFQYIEKTTIPLPPLAEQHRIVAKIEELFSDLDHSVAALETAQAQLKIYRQAVLKYAFEGKLTEQWRQQNAPPPAADLLARIQTARKARYQQQLEEWQAGVKEWEAQGKPGRKPAKPKKPKKLPPLTKEELAELPSLPEGWGWQKLGNIVEKIQIGPFGSQLHKEDYISNGIPLINPKHIKDQKIIPEPEVTITTEKYKDLPQYILEQNDIVMGRRGEMGRSAPVTEREDGWFCGSGSLYIRPLSLCSAKLYSLMISSNTVRRYLDNSSIGTTFKNLNSTILNNMPMPVISINEQQAILQEIEARLSVVDNLEETIATALQQAEALRQSILKQAFAGKLVPQDPNDEPAGVLLERIQTQKAQ